MRLSHPLVLLFALAVAGYAVMKQVQVALDAPAPFVRSIGGVELTFWRNEHGMLEAKGPTLEDSARAIGYMHARDRLAQMEITRTAAAGRLSEKLANTGATVALDQFLRDMGFAAAAREALRHMAPEPRQFLEDYAEGVNVFLAEQESWSFLMRPLEFLLAGVREVEPWTAEDTMGITMIMSYLGLSSTQHEWEKLALELLQRGVSTDQLADLIGQDLGSHDADLEEVIRKVRLHGRVFPTQLDETIRHVAPSLRASNNWAVSGAMSATGTPLMASDPHMETNRLPCVWYETVYHVDGADGAAGNGNRFVTGITVPGLPSVLMGRTQALLFSFTYGYMDQFDFYIEEVRDGKVRRGDTFEPLQVREEVLVPKGLKYDRSQKTVDAASNAELADEHGLHFAKTLFFYHTEFTTIERGSHQHGLPIADGFYVGRAVANNPFTRRGSNEVFAAAAKSFDPTLSLLRATTVEEAADAVKHLSVSTNWVLADQHGKIAYQQSGVAPIRAPGDRGILPKKGWDVSTHWLGVVDPDELYRLVQSEGSIATANNDWQRPDGPLTVNMHMGDYRSRRAEQMLAESGKVTLDDMKHIQCDVYSLQAEELMKVIRPLLPDTVLGRVLRDWDMEYSLDSRGATVFEEVYAGILEHYVGGVVGVEQWRTMARTSWMLAYFHYLDNFCIRHMTERPEEARAVLAKLLPADATYPKVWGEVNVHMMNNVVLGGKLPAFLGFDLGPVPVPGSRATLVQGQVFTEASGRSTGFAPSWRMISDVADTTALETIIPGGPSGHRLSSYYTNEVERYANCAYKTVRLTPPSA